MTLLLLVLNFLLFTWWLWVFFLFFVATESLWRFYKQSKFKKAIKWSLMELRIPREVKRSAKAMEQILAAIHSLRNSPGNLRETYLEGQVTRWFSLEIISFGGEVHFYIRTPEQFKALIQSPFFSYYPDVEVVDVDDYVGELPQNTAELYNRDLDLWGTEMVLDKDPAYPIKTYISFESAAEESRLDPIGHLLEILGRLKSEEFAAIQLTITPKNNKKWRDKSKGEIDKIRENITKPLAAQKAGYGGKLKVDFSQGFPFPVINPADKKDEKQLAPVATPGLSTLLGAVESNLSKPAFDTIIRVAYMGPKAAFYDSFVRSGIMAYFNQYAALDLNSFKANNAAGTKAASYKFPFFFVKERTEFKKQRYLYNFRNREIPEETFIGKVMTSYLLNFNDKSKLVPLSTESLATLFHIPTSAVMTGPHVKRVESRKVGPSAGMAIFGEEGELDKFQ